MNATTYTVRMVCDGGVSEKTTIEATTLNEARKAARAAARAWTEEGEWGKEGASVETGWELLDDDGDVLLDEAGDEVRGIVTVEIEPDHESLIYDACGGRHDDRHERCCGNSPNDHDWTSEGEGGCDSNPGVWATGGTSMVFASHCRKCGLHRREHHCGSQRNPGEHDTVEYEMPKTWYEE